ncbi:hypothetical protein AC579_2607 [Pseudocercospora musae]|uniref:Uncharacterized protein n=1 Tax=Pseudocercospora musae TaxID=113226 RepID=A0A139I1L8_9PEZI|nr:hypothetical protein AC579_2607 [Pseudocercospora musae]
MPNAQLDVALHRAGILCALSQARAAVEAALDEKHKWPKDCTGHDGNLYSFGKVGEHNVVIASLSEGKMGKGAAASNDIRLADFVISQPACDHEELSERYGYQGAENDNLFPPNYAHLGASEPCNNTNPFRRCKAKKHIERNARPRMHYGNIASGDEVVENGVERERIALYASRWRQQV